jgi:predicted ArsR family transcriptional regulator
VDALERAILHELATARALTASDLAERLQVAHWANLSTALSSLVAAGYVSVIGPLGRAETTYRIHARGRAQQA